MTLHNKIKAHRVFVSMSSCRFRRRTGLLLWCGRKSCKCRWRWRY